MNFRKVTVFAVLATASLVPTAAFAATATTLPTNAVAPVATKAAPVAVTPVATVAPVAASKAKTSTKAATPAAIVVAGNFCKKVLVGKSSNDKAGTVLKCVADAKGQPRWTK